MRATVSNIPANSTRTEPFAPFLFGMRSDKESGRGANLQINAKRENSVLVKMSGDSLWHTYDKEIEDMFVFQKEDGTFQFGVIVDVSGSKKFRAIELTDKSEVVPANDITLTDPDYSFAQLSAGKGYLGSASIEKWDGTTLTTVANSINPSYLTNDGFRLVAGDIARRKFSSSDIQTSNDFNSGAGVNKGGDYNSVLPAIGAKQAGEAVFFVARRGAETHKVIENAVADGVSSNTKLPLMYNGAGIDNKRKFDVLNNLAYLLNDKDFIELNIFSGKPNRLFEFGAIRKYFLEWTQDNAQVFTYDDENLACVLISDGVANSIVILVQVGLKERDVFIRRSQFFDKVVAVQGDLYAYKGKNIYKLFDSNSNINSEPREFDYFSEFKDFGDINIEKFFKELRVVADMNANSSMEVSVYVNGDTQNPVSTKTITAQNLQSTPDTVAAYGRYVFGTADPNTNTDNSTAGAAPRFHGRFNSVAIRIKEKSVYDFSLKNIFLDFSSSGVRRQSITTFNQSA